MRILERIFGRSGEDAASHKPVVPRADVPLVTRGYLDTDLTTPSEPVLAGGKPLYYALLKDPNPIVIKPGEANEAKSLLSRVRAHNPQEVAKCQGLTREAAARILRAILADADRGNAANGGTGGGLKRFHIDSPPFGEFFELQELLEDERGIFAADFDVPAVFVVKTGDDGGSNLNRVRRILGYGLSGGEFFYRFRDSQCFG